MSDPAILFVKPKAISATDKAALGKAGVIVIEIDDPSAVRLVRAHAELPTTSLLLAAVQAIGGADYTGTPHERFGKAVAHAIKVEAAARAADDRPTKPKRIPHSTGGRR